MTDPSFRLEIRGGRPSPQQVAALTAAIAGIAASTPQPEVRPRASGWARAARLESVGQAPFISSDDPRLAPHV